MKMSTALATLFADCLRGQLHSSHQDEVLKALARASRGLLAWIVEMEPSWPVFIA